MQCAAQGHTQFFATNLPCLTSSRSIQDVTDGRGLIYSTGRSKSRPLGQWAVFSGSCPEILFTGSCVPEAHKTQEESPGRRPMFVSSKPCPLALPSSGFPGRRVGLVVSKLSLPWNVLQPWCTGSTQPLHSCSFLTPICLPTWTSPHLGSCSSFIQQSIIECQVLF